jgi:predicted nucleotidyltransferase
MSPPVPAFLPGWAADVVRPLLAICEADERFLGVSVNGSMAAGASDEFSDLDLVIVCRDGFEDEVVAGGAELAARLGPLLASFTAEHVGAPELLIGLYGPPLRHVDLKFVPLSGLANRVEDGVVLWDRTGEVASAFAAAPAVWPAPELQWIEDRFWIWVHYLAVKIGRGELFESADGLGFLRAAVLGPLIAIERGVRPQGVRRIEQIAPEAMPALERTVAVLDAASCVAGTRATIALYRELREAAADPALVRRAAAEEASVAYLAEIEARLPPNP